MRRVLLASLAVILLTNVGCLRRWRQQEDPYLRGDMQMRRDYVPREYAPQYGYPPPGAPGAAVPGVNGQPEVLTPQPPPTGPMPNSGMPPNASGYAPLPGSGLQPAEFPPRFGPRTGEEPPLARATPADPRPPRVLQLPPDLAERRAAENIAPPNVPETPPSSPVGIPLFTEIKDKISTGQKPDIEGLDWLKANKYHTVIYLRRPGATDSADREQVEGRGMKYISIEVSPATLTKEMIDQFGKTISDAGNQPVFVYDRDGVLTGAVSYLHLRLNDKVPDELARSKAGLIGLKEKGTDEAAALWTKIQELLK